MTDTRNTVLEQHAATVEELERDLRLKAEQEQRLNKELRDMRYRADEVRAAAADRCAEVTDEVHATHHVLRSIRLAESDKQQAMYNVTAARQQLQQLTVEMASVQRQHQRDAEEHVRQMQQASLLVDSLRAQLKTSESRVGDHAILAERLQRAVCASRVALWLILVWLA